MYLLISLDYGLIYACPPISTVFTIRCQKVCGKYCHMGSATGLQQGVTKRCRLSWLTNSALVYEHKCGGREGAGLSANEYSCVYHVTWSPNKLCRSNSIFNLWFAARLSKALIGYIHETKLRQPIGRKDSKNTVLK